MEDYDVAYLPSATMLRAAGEEISSSGKLLALAPESAQLEHTENEVHSVAAYFPGRRSVLTGSTAKEDTFKRLAPDFDMLHLATHGSFNKFNPLLSGLVLEEGSGEDGQLQVHEILGLHLRADLVTLSACDTALASGYFADTPVGDEFVGLARAFMFAGADTILASLWQVDDRSTAEFMGSFYSRLARAGKAESLAQVQRQMSGSDSEYRHPYYWAPFVLLGDVAY